MVEDSNDSLILNLKNMLPRLLYEHDFLQYCINGDDFNSDFKNKRGLSNETTGFLLEILNEFKAILLDNSNNPPVLILNNLVKRLEYECTF